MIEQSFIKKVEIINNEEAKVTFDIGRTYLLDKVFLQKVGIKLPILKISIKLNGSYIEINDANNNIHEIPWDFILYKLEPEYMYFGK